MPSVIFVDNGQMSRHQLVPFLAKIFIRGTWNVVHIFCLVHIFCARWRANQFDDHIFCVGHDGAAIHSQDRRFTNNQTTRLEEKKLPNVAEGDDKC